MVVPYLSNDSFSGIVVFEEKVICLDEELAGVFLSLGHPLLPQQDGVTGVSLGVELLLRAAHVSEWTVNENSIFTPTVRGKNDVRYC